MTARSKVHAAVLTPAYTAADLRYDPAQHRSWLPDGREVPHVTAVLGAVGVSTDFDELAAFGPALARRIEDARALGTAVHADCHAYDDGDLLLETVDSRVWPFLEAWQACRADKGLVPFQASRERRLFHPLYVYAGIADGVFSCGGKIVLADIKTGDPDSAAAHLQTAAYEAPWNLAHPELRVDERWAIQLTPGRRTPYRVLNYTAREDAWMDFPKWSACLSVYNEQPPRRKKLAC